jgi:hypothetical protein
LFRQIRLLPRRLPATEPMAFALDKLRDVPSHHCKEYAAASSLDFIHSKFSIRNNPKKLQPKLPATIWLFASPILIMQRISLIALAIVTAVLAVQLPAAAQNPVVVELFTSEGCSSCPPADAILLQLSQQNPSDGTELILLGEHVDYWDNIGWVDRFSSRQLSARQSEYAHALHATVYTPQMVIDGEEQFVGNGAAEVRSRIAAAAKQPKPAQVSLAWEGKSGLRVDVHSAQPLKADVLLAIMEAGLSTQVPKGENAGKTLHHAAVVRQLREIGKLDNGTFEKTIDVARDPQWQTANLKAAILVQDPSSKRILGAGVVAFPQ